MQFRFVLDSIRIGKVCVTIRTVIKGERRTTDNEKYSQQVLHCRSFGSRTNRHTHTLKYTHTAFMQIHNFHSIWPSADQCNLTNKFFLNIFFALLVSVRFFLFAVVGIRLFLSVLVFVYCIFHINSISIVSFYGDSLNSSAVPKKNNSYFLIFRKYQGRRTVVGLSFVHFEIEAICVDLFCSWAGNKVVDSLLRCWIFHACCKFHI